MKRLTVAGLFAMIGGAATLLMVASILYSCRQGGHPHEMGNDSHSSGDNHSSIVEEHAEPTATARRAQDAAPVTLPHA